MERQSGFTLQQKLLAAAFFIGPLLLLFSVGAFTLGIGLIPPGITSYIEGMFGAYALMLFIPIYLELAGRLSRTHKILGAVTTITGLFGAAVGASLELMRVIEYALRQHGAGDTVWQSFYAAPNWEFLLVALLGPLFPLTSILLGVGFFRAKTFPAWVSMSLVCAGIFFPLAQVLEWDLGLKLFYPLAAVLWLAALSFVGREYTRSLA